MELKKAALDVVLVTKQLETMIAFYRDQLDLAEAGRISIPGNCEIVRMACGDSAIRICQAVSPPVGSAPEGEMLTATGIRAICLAVANLKESVEQWQAAGVAIQVNYRELRPGFTIAVIEDPDGNAIELQCQQ